MHVAVAVRVCALVYDQEFTWRHQPCCAVVACLTKLRPKDNPCRLHVWPKQLNDQTMRQQNKMLYLLLFMRVCFCGFHCNTIPHSADTLTAQPFKRNTRNDFKFLHGTYWTYWSYKSTMVKITDLWPLKSPKYVWFLNPGRCKLAANRCQLPGISSCASAIFPRIQTPMSGRRGRSLEATSASGNKRLWEVFATDFSRVIYTSSAFLKCYQMFCF